MHVDARRHHTPALSVHVSGVISVCPKPQMRRQATRRIIATVQHEQPIRNSPECQQPRQSVGELASEYKMTQLSVAVCVEWPGVDKTPCAGCKHWRKPVGWITVVRVLASPVTEHAATIRDYRWLPVKGVSATTADAGYFDHHSAISRWSGLTHIGLPQVWVSRWPRLSARGGVELSGSPSVNEKQSGCAQVPKSPSTLNANCGGHGNPQMKQFGRPRVRP